jgi:hypothetical protein
LGNNAIGDGQGGGPKMKRPWLVWFAVTLFFITYLGMALPCFADGEGTDPGDPYDEVPLSKTLDPTPRTLSSFWMILMAMAFQLAL